MLLRRLAGKRRCAGNYRKEKSEIISVYPSASPKISFSKQPFDLLSLRVSCCILTLLSAHVLITQHAMAEQFAPYDEIKKKSAIFESRPSFDTTPVTVSVVDVVYRIPRNYLTHLEPAIPTLKVTWPGLKPLTEETRKCFGSILQSEQAGCTSLELHLLGSRGPSPGGRALNNAEKFANFLKHSDPKRRQGPLNYEIYETGPEEARTETYRRLDGNILFHCSFSGEQDRRRGGVCNDTFQLDDMNHVQFFFRLLQIEDVPAIEAGVRRLLASFVFRGVQQQ